jgi:hypothetical protein
MIITGRSRNITQSKIGYVIGAGVIGDMKQAEAAK